MSDIRYIELFVGDVCNLKCLTCFPELSTSWQQDYKKLGWSFKKKSTSKTANFIDPTLTNLQRVKFVGGEPFLCSSHTETLNKLIKLRTENIELEYSTNVMVWPGNEVLEHWKTFKKIEIWMSIDGYGPLNEYIRYPSKWNIVEENVKKYVKLAKLQNNIELKFMTTVSSLNVWNLNTLEKWFEEIKEKTQCENLKFLYMNPLVEPKFLSIQALPDEFKQKAIQFLNLESSNQRSVSQYMLRSQFEIDPEFIHFITSIDRIRNLRIQDFIPEIANLLSNFSSTVVKNPQN